MLKEVISKYREFESESTLQKDELRKKVIRKDMDISELKQSHEAERAKEK